MTTPDGRGGSCVPDPCVLPSELDALGYAPEGNGPGLGTLLVRRAGEVGVDAPVLLARPVATLGCRPLEGRLERLGRVGAMALAPLDVVPGPGRCWLLRPWLGSTASDEGPTGRRSWAAWLEEEGPEAFGPLWAEGFLHGHLVASNLGVSPDGRRWFLDGGIRWAGVARRAALAEERRALARLVAGLRGEDDAPGNRHGRRRLRGPGARDGALVRAGGRSRTRGARPAGKVALGVAALVASGAAALWWEAAPTRVAMSEPSGSPADARRPGSEHASSRHLRGRRAKVPNCSLVGARGEPGPCELRVVAARRVEAFVGGVVVGNWVVGRPGDDVVLGRWWCGPVAEAATYDPRTGTVSLFGGWPSVSGGQLRAVAVRASGVLDGQVSVTSSGPAGRCQRLVVRPGRSRH